EPGKRLSLVFLVLFAASTLYLTFIIARPFLTPILIATLIAIAIYPAFQHVSRRIPNRSGAALAATVIVLIAIVLPTVLIVERLAHETAALYAWLHERQAVEGGWREYFGTLLDPALEWTATRTGMSVERLRQMALERLQGVNAALLKWARSMLVNLGETVVYTIIMLVTLFFLLRDGERIRDRIGRLLPIEARRYQQLIDTISASITANLYGVIAVALAQATLGCIGYAIAGLPSVALWSVATAISSMIPLAGAASVWVAGTVLLLITGNWGKAIFLAIWGAGVISTADNVVRPLVLSRGVKLHTLLVFFSLLGGVRAFGIIGLFLGPIIVSVAMALLDILEEERQEWGQSPIRMRPGDNGQ
ncbi:MAG TPA: AI-2E family transporter, partial [Bryobacteraceae bacterium]|nr:AI-2E family transporter [Bryobacteraceae bacterium]